MPSLTSNGSNSSKFPMTSYKPYLIEALNRWIVDNGLTPYILVNTNYPDVNVPAQYVDNGKIVLNISPVAVNSFVIDAQHVEFDARFRGILEYIYVPMGAILAIYAKENGRGMAFEEENDFPPSPPPGKKENIEKFNSIPGSGKDGINNRGKKGGHLWVVK